MWRGALSIAAVETKPSPGQAVHSQNRDGYEVYGCGREGGGREVLWHIRVLCPKTEVVLLFFSSVQFTGIPISVLRSPGSTGLSNLQFSSVKPSLLLFLFYETVLSMHEIPQIPAT